MKKFFKRLFVVVLCLFIGYAGFRYGPALYVRLFGDGGVRWVSEKFSETLRDKNELIVSEFELTGQETVTQDAWLLGTVQKVEMPYAFQLSYAVDLSLAKAEADGRDVVVRVPKPRAAYHKLIVDDAKMRKTDFFYPLTPERYAEIKKQVEDRLYAEYAGSEDNLAQAWAHTVASLESLFAAVVESGRQQGETGAGDIGVRVVMDAALTQPTEAPQLTPTPQN